jgi:Tfp pilus assembly PilM family ATPase
LVEEKEIKNMVDYQVEGFLGRSKKDFIIDYSFSFKKDKTEVSYVCVYKQIFDLYYAIAKRSDFKVNKILMEQKCYSEFILDKDYMVVDIGGEVTSFSVFCNGDLEVVENLYKGGETFTTLFASGNDVSFDEAEKIKREKGLLVDKNKYYFYPQLNNILDKINIFLKEYPIKKIYFTGGGSNIKGGIEYFKEKLNIPVSFFDCSILKDTNLSDDLLNRLGNSILINKK